MNDINKKIDNALASVKKILSSQQFYEYIKIISSQKMALWEIRDLLIKAQTKILRADVKNFAFEIDLSGVGYYQLVAPSCTGLSVCLLSFTVSTEYYTECGFRYSLENGSYPAFYNSYAFLLAERGGVVMCGGTIDDPLFIFPPSRAVFFDYRNHHTTGKLHVAGNYFYTELEERKIA